MMSVALKTFAIGAVLCIVAAITLSALIDAGFIAPFPVPDEPPVPRSTRPDTPDEDLLRIETVPIPNVTGPIPEHTARFGDYALTVPDQKPGMGFFANGIRFPIDGWIAVYPTAGNIPNLERPLGAFFFPAAPDDEQGGGGLLGTPLVDGRTYVAAMHGDDGDLSFDRTKDPIMRDMKQTLFLIRFRADENAILP